MRAIQDSREARLAANLMIHRIYQITFIITQKALCREGKSSLMDNYDK